MQEINRAMADNLDASEMLRKITEAIPPKQPQDMLATDHYETRAERRARQRAEAKAAQRLAKAER